MAAAKYDKIYIDLKHRIEQQEFAGSELLPSEHELVEQYHCSRNTIRRAVADLAAQGYVQSIHGKGVQVIYQPTKQAEFTLGRIESFKESTIRNQKESHTFVLRFEEIWIDEALHQLTTMPIGTPVYYVQRVRHLDGLPLILDHNYFRRDIVRDLTPEIAADSVYEYIEGTLHETIVTTKRIMTVERANQLDQRYLALEDCNCVAVVTNFTYNADGILFEYTQSRHQPDHFIFYDQAQRMR